jgi:hypothetical protein
VEAAAVSIPLSTTTIRIDRVPLSATRDSYDVPPAASQVATGVRAHLSAPSGREILAGGSKEIVDRHLDCDVVDLLHGDTVTDLTTSVTYTVVWVHKRLGLGLDRMEAGLRIVAGVA